MAPCAGLKFKYKMGPIPSGLSTQVELELLAEGGVLRDDGLFDLVHTLVLTRKGFLVYNFKIISNQICIVSNCS